MSGCARAHQAIAIARRAEERARRAERLLALLADHFGVDLAVLEHLDTIDRRGGQPVTWTECLALGWDPDNGRPAA